MTSNAPPTSLAELARLFLKLGMVAFGGPPAHIAMMEDEVVSRRRWLTREQFLDFLGATNLIPGPNSTEMAIHVGRVRAGLPGLVVAGASFILPSAVMVAALAWAYVRYGSLPEVSGVMYGVKPIVIAVIVQAVFKLARTAVKSSWLAVVGALAVWQPLLAWINWWCWRAAVCWLELFFRYGPGKDRRLCRPFLPAEPP